MNVFFYTLGCKVNQYETQSIREAFINRGYTAVSDSSVADIAVINSCTVTAESDRKTRQALHRLRRENPNLAIILTGCMAQTFSGDLKELEDADIIIGNTDIEKLVSLTEQFLKTGEKTVCVMPHEKKERYNTPDITDFAERTRAYMKIEDGCDRYCTYCIIPYARGFVRSKAKLDIKREAENLAKKGFIEVVLVGINLSSYGKGEDLNLCDAVDAVCEVEGIKRVRLGSLEPDHISDEMLQRLSLQEKFCPQFHLSLQSGCDQTLKRMNRHYDSAFYIDLVNRIRKTFENPAVTTDIMVGFAGETEEEFFKSLEFFKKVGFAKSHVFAYSRRKGTVADKFKEQVPKSEKLKRSKMMLLASAKSEKEFLKTQVGLTEEVLFETFDGVTAYGYTKNYSRIAVNTKLPLDGQIKKVIITDSKDDYCIGELAF